MEYRSEFRSVFPKTKFGEIFFQNLKILIKKSKSHSNFWFWHLNHVFKNLKFHHFWDLLNSKLCTVRGANSALGLCKKNQRTSSYFFEVSLPLFRRRFSQKTKMEYRSEFRSVFQKIFFWGRLIKNFWFYTGVKKTRIFHFLHAKVQTLILLRFPQKHKNFDILHWNGSFSV